MEKVYREGKEQKKSCAYAAKSPPLRPPPPFPQGYAWRMFWRERCNPQAVRRRAGKNGNISEVHIFRQEEGLRTRPLSRRSALGLGVGPLAFSMHSPGGGRLRCIHSRKHDCSASSYKYALHQAYAQATLARVIASPLNP